MRARAGIVLVTALVLAGTDLVVQAAVAADSSFAHHRSYAWVEVSVGLFVFALLLARLPSRLLAAGAGVFAGGLLGNLVSAAMHGRAVANPFVVGDVAFNLADVFVLAGIVLTIVATMRLAVGTGICSRSTRSRSGSCGTCARAARPSQRRRR